MTVSRPGLVRHSHSVCLSLMSVFVSVCVPPGAGETLPFRLSVCLHVCLRVCLSSDRSVYRLVCLSVCLSALPTGLSVSLPACLSVCLPSVCLPVCLPTVCLSADRSVCQPATWDWLDSLSVCLSACLFVCQSSCLSVCLSVYLPASYLQPVRLCLCLSVCLSANKPPAPSETLCLTSIIKRTSRQHDITKVRVYK